MRQLSMLLALLWGASVSGHCLTHQVVYLVIWRCLCIGSAFTHAFEHGVLSAASSFYPTIRQNFVLTCPPNIKQMVMIHNSSPH